MDLIKCHICKLNKGSCNCICVDMDDVSELYIDEVTEEKQVLQGFCTNHNCEHNPSGFRCEAEMCLFSSK